MLHSQTRDNPASMSLPARETFCVHGLAVVSRDGFIGRDAHDLPNTWASIEDFHFLQSQLATGGTCVMGHTTHKLVENIRGRQRVVFSKHVSDPELRDRFTLFVNPAELQPVELLRICANHGESAKVFVLGGTSIYDYFLSQVGYDRFDLTRESNIVFGTGIPLFSSIPFETLSSNLSAHGLDSAKPSPLNQNGLELLSFAKPTK